MKLSHHLGGLEGLPGPLNLEKRVFVEDWEKRIFGIHVAMMGAMMGLTNIPQRRMGDPERDIGRAVVFLVRPDAEFINATSLPVDGGGLYLR
jgi:NAD(P)-dependent dehydrogenase (short-subunit alcohol dehydrogenase family)